MLYGKEKKNNEEKSIAANGALEAAIAEIIQTHTQFILKIKLMLCQLSRRLCVLACIMNIASEGIYVLFFLPNNISNTDNNSCVQSSHSIFIHQFCK